jgi:hypothetical protein
VDEEFKVIKTPLPGFESQRLARCQLLKELLRRRLPGGGWSHTGTQVGTEPTALVYGVKSRRGGSCRRS